MARREAAQALTKVMEMNHEVAAIEGSLMQVAYQEAKDSVTFFGKDLANRVVDGDRPLYLTAFLGASQIKRALIDTDASTNILPLPTFNALGLGQFGHPLSCMEWSTSYHIILGRPWLKAYKAVASSYHQCVKAIWRNRQMVIEATKMPFDGAELHFVEAALYQEYEHKGENRILQFNSIALQVEEEDNGEVVESERPSKIRRITRPYGWVVYEF
nr:hypothetical protein CFP56_55321 [Quercus suber]